MDANHSCLSAPCCETKTIESALSTQQYVVLSRTNELAIVEIDDGRITSYSRVRRTDLGWRAGAGPDDEGRLPRRRPRDGRLHGAAQQLPAGEESLGRHRSGTGASSNLSFRQRAYVRALAIVSLPLLLYPQFGRRGAQKKRRGKYVTVPREGCGAQGNLNRAGEMRPHPRGHWRRAMWRVRWDKGRHSPRHVARRPGQQLAAGMHARLDAKACGQDFSSQGTPRPRVSYGRLVMDVG